MPSRKGGEQRSVDDTEDKLQDVHDVVVIPRPDRQRRSESATPMMVVILPTFK